MSYKNYFLTFYIADLKPACLHYAIHWRY